MRDWALLVGLAFNAVAIYFGMVLLARRLEAVHREMNGMKDALIAAAKIEGLALGEIKGREDEQRRHEQSAG